MLLDRSIGLAIVLFWTVMNVWLIKHHLSAPASIIAMHASEKITDNVEEWWGVFYRGEKIGYASQTITPKPRLYAARSVGY